MAETRLQRGGADVLLTAWRRRKGLFLAVAAGTLVAAISLAYFLPDRYKATVTFLVERQDLEDTLLRPGDAEDALETRLQTVGERILSRARLEDLIHRFDLYADLRARGATQESVVEQMRRDIRLLPKASADPNTHTSTIALALSYFGSNPKQVGEVANTLAQTYVDDDLKSRQRQASEAAAFLKTQLDLAKTRYEESSSAQARLLDRRRALSRPLGALDPNSGPDSVGARLAKLRLELTELKTKYRDQHPEVIRVQDEIKALERQLPGPNAAPVPPSDPTARMRESLAGVESGLMTSDYESDKEHYLALVKRYEDARLNESMAQNRQGDQFRILDPAVVPEHPVAPNRILLLLGGLAGAVALGIAAVALAEKFDTSFHGVGDLREFTSVPVLASIPRIATAHDARRRRRRAFIGALATAVALFLIVQVSHVMAGLFGPIILSVMGGRS